MEIKKTSLNKLHQSNNAKFVEFAGYEMPIQYGKGIIEEHKFTRTHSGIFDLLCAEFRADVRRFNLLAVSDDEASPLLVVFDESLAPATAVRLLRSSRKVGSKARWRREPEAPTCNRKAITKSTI